MTLLLLSLTVLLLLGIPIAYALGLSGFIYFLIDQPLLLGILPQRLYSGMESYSMIALPLFCLMGYLMNAGGITARLIDFSLLFVGRFRGGLGLVNVLSSMIFGGISGSSVSDTASVGAILIPEMQKKGYSVEYSSGITVASSTMGMIIPPSVPMIIYALAAEQSVGRLFLASAIPGILIGVLMLVITLVISYRKKLPREATQLSTTEKKKCLQRAILALIMPVFVIGSIVLGVATATEAAAIGVLYSLLVGFLVFKTLRLRDIPELVQKAIITSANVMIIIAFSKLYIWILALERVPQMLASGGDEPGAADLCRIYHRDPDHSGLRHLYRRLPGHLITHPGLSAAGRRLWHGRHSVRGYSDHRPGGGSGDSPGRHVPERGLGHFQAGNRGDFHRRAAVSGRQSAHPFTDRFCTGVNSLATITVNAVNRTKRRKFLWTLDTRSTPTTAKPLAPISCARNT